MKKILLIAFLMSLNINANTSFILRENNHFEIIEKKAEETFLEKIFWNWFEEVENTDINDIEEHVSRSANEVEASEMSAAMMTVGPGGVATNLQLWLRADHNGGITTDGTTVTTWDNPNGDDFTIFFGAPSYENDLSNTVNFNPVIDFKGDDFYINTSSNFGLTGVEVTTFGVVGKYNSETPRGSLHPLFARNDNSLDGAQFIMQESNDQIRFKRFGGPTDIGNKIINRNESGIYGASRDAAGQGYFYDGGIVTNGSVDTTVFNSSTRYYVGAEHTGKVAVFTMPELLVYDRHLTALERSRVESYLYFKYGKTLATDYIASDGTTKMWEKANNTGYENDVFGIGKDIASGLDQRISKSVNTGSIMTVSLDNDFTKANNDVARTTAHTNDLQFLMFSNNGTPASPLQTNELEASVDYNYRIGKEWKVSKTANFTHTVNLKFESYNDDWFLIKVNNTTGDFSTGVTSLGQLDATGEITGITLADGDYITLAKMEAFPGGVTANLQLWLKADTNVYSDASGTTTATNDGSLQLWKDASPSFNDFSQSTSSKQPIYKEAGAGTNFNSAISFEVDAHTLRSSLVIDDASYSFFVVYSKDEENPGDSRALNGVTRNWLIGPYHGSPAHFAGGWVTSVGSPPDSNASLFNTDKAIMTMATNNGTASVNTLNGAGATVDGSHVGTPGELSLGNEGVFNEPMDGDIAEVIFFDRVLTVSEQEQVRSYLALKYGLSIDQNTATDYIASDGTTKIWTAANNTGYDKNIFGIGRDDDAGLDQRISKSIDSYSADNAGIITISLDEDFTKSNIDMARTTMHTNDKQFLLFSNNGMSVAPLQTTELESSVNYNFRIEKEWRVSKTINFTQAVNLKFEGYNDDWFLIKVNNATGDFSTGVTSLGQLDATGEITGVTLADGDYITLAKKQTYPGGIATNLQLWLKADAGISGTGVTTWLDQSPLGNDATKKGTIAANVVANRLNFNPTVYIDLNSSNGWATSIKNVEDYAIVGFTDPSSAPANWSYLLGNDESSGGNREDLMILTGSTDGYSAPISSRNAVFAVNGKTDYANPYILPHPEAVPHIMYGDNDLALTNGLAIGTRNSNIQQTWHIGELISYGTNHTANDRLQINSYLALKYGIGLDQSTATNYLASDGTIIWNAGDNGSNKNDIFGIGRDDDSSLDQLISKSTNTESILTVSLDNDFAKANNDATRTTMHTNDKQFLLFSNNGMSVAPLQTTELESSVNYNFRIEKEWRVSKTINFTQAVNLKFEGYNDDWFLIKVNNATGDFSTGVTSLGQLDATGEITGVTLADGDYITLAKKQTYPGGIATNLQLWLKADAGISGTGVTTWLDQSPLGNDATKKGTIAANVVTNRLNFNPTVYIDLNSSNGWATSIKNVEDYAIVGFTDPSSAPANWSYLLGNDESSGGNREDLMILTGSTDGYSAPISSRNAVFAVNGKTDYANPYILPHPEAVPHIMYGDNDLALTNGLAIGTRNSNIQQTWHIGELISYGTNHTANDRLQINSYLALKYGIGLDQSTATNYLASDGTIIWNSANNTNYKNGIFGIGRDDDSNLDQLISKSTNTESILTASLDNDFTKSNNDVARTTMHTNDKQFLLFSNNGMSVFPLQTAELDASSGYDYRIEKEWRVSKTTNFTQAVNLKFKGYNDDWSLIKVNNATGDFSTGITSLGELDATGRITGVTLADGDYITLAKKQLSPGGVITNLKLWLKADTSVYSDVNCTPAANDGNLQLWKDASPSFNDFSQSTSSKQPIYKEAGAGTNFNPAISFETDAHTLRSSLVIDNASYSFFVVYSKDEENPGFSRALNGVTRNWLIGPYNGSPSYHAGDWVTPGSTPISANASLFNTDKAIMTMATNNGTASVNTLNGADATVDGSHVGTPGELALGNEGVFNGPMDGDIAEVIFFDRVLTVSEQKQVRSYLALKYGLSIDQNTATDYIASDGTTKIWTAANNTGYDKNIFGIGRDDETGLDQRISKSVDSYSADNAGILTVSLDNDFTKANNDAARTTANTNDKQFLLFSNNGDATTTQTTELDASMGLSRVSREWKSTAVNFTQKVHLKFNDYGIGWHLVESDDDDFGSGIAFLGKLDAAGVVSDVSIANGKYYTLFRAPSLTVSKSAVTVAEDGGTETFTVVLDEEPTGDVVISLTSSDVAEATASPATLTFTSGNWATAQTVTITGVNDDIDRDADTATITVAVKDDESANEYDVAQDETITVTATDDDTAGYTVSKTTATVTEDGGTDTFTVKLDTEPTSNVAFTIVSDKTGEATVDKSSLTFTTTNWATAQTVTITGVNDDIDRDDSATITISVDDANSDDSYDALADKTIAVTATDDDSSPVITSSSTGTNLAENSGANQVVYTVTATDADAGSTLSYAFASGTDDSLLTIDSTTGAVKLTADPDFETKSSYSFNVKASDGTNDSTVKTVTFSITDEADTVVTWMGGTGEKDPNDATNWSPAAVPTATDILNISSTDQISWTTNFTIGVINIAPGGSLISSGTITGTINAKRTLGANWHLVSSSVVGQDIDAFVAASVLATGDNDNIGLAPYNNTTGTWSYYQTGTAGSGNFIPGTGQSIKKSAAGDITFSGNFNSADVTVSVAKNASNGFNLVGNPYTSYVSVKEILEEIDNATLVEQQTIWLWDATSGSSGEYIEYNLIQDLEIAPGQGFFVEGKAAGSLKIMESMQSHSSDTFKKGESTIPQIELMMTSEDTQKKTRIFYVDRASKGFDNGYDSSIFEGFSNSLAVYTHTIAGGSGRNLGIQALPKDRYESMIIPVGVNAASGSDLTFSVESLNLPVGMSVYLEDKENNSFTKLDRESYAVTISSDLNGVGRFYLHTTSTALTTSTEVLENVNIYLSDKNTLQVEGVQKGEAILQLYSIVGKKVLNTTFTGNGNNHISLPDFPTGVYFVELKRETGTLKQKLIIE